MSYWLDNAPFQTSGAIIQQARAQAVVIGGPAGRNGSRLASGLAVDFVEAVRRYGLEAALTLYQFTLETVEVIRAFVAEHGAAYDMDPFRPDRFH